MSKFQKPTYWIQGNHDFALHKRFGVDIDKYLTDDNWTYLGVYQGDIDINNKHFRLLHPSGSNTYSISYPAQKYIRNLNRSDSLDWLILGHFHRGYFFQSNGINILGAMAYQRQTPFAKRRGLGEDIGYWILEFTKDNYKLIKRNF